MYSSLTRGERAGVLGTLIVADKPGACSAVHDAASEQHSTRWKMAVDALAQEVDK